MKKILSLVLSLVIMAGILSIERLVADRQPRAQAPVATIQELNDHPAKINKEIQSEVPEEEFLYQPQEQDDQRAIWAFERHLPVENVDRRVVTSSDSGVVKSSYGFDAGRESTCRYVLNYIFRMNEADTVARENQLFDVCENVRSVGRDDVKLRWDNNDLGRELTIELERNKRHVEVTYKMPLFGH